MGWVPVAVSVWVYGAPTVPPGKDVVVMAGALIVTSKPAEVAI